MWLIRGRGERGGARGFATAAAAAGDVTAVWLAGDGEEAGCSLPPLHNGAVLIGVGRAAGGLERKEGGEKEPAMVHSPPVKAKESGWVEHKTGQRSLHPI